jgi:DnaJ like chaperone protein
MRQLAVALVLRTIGVRGLAIVLAFVLLDVACFHGLSVFAIDHFVWISANVGALVFGPVIWREHRRFGRRGPSFTRRQPKKEPLTGVRKAEKECEEERRRLEELRCEAQRQQEARRQRQAEQEREAERRQKAEEERASDNLCQRERRQATAQTQPEWWRILEVAASASKEEIVCKYRRKVQQCHPDRVAGLAPEFVQLAEERTKALNLAYEQAMRTSQAIRSLSD